MTIKEIISHLESIAPIAYQESYDNAGLIVGDSESNIEAALLCLDVTEEVVEEAINLGCQLIVAHHPIIFRGLKKLNGSNYVERTVIKAIRNNVAIYAIHTNLDNVFANGVNAKIAEKLRLQNIQILSPRVLPTTAHSGNEEAKVGAGMIGTLPQQMPESDFLRHLKTKMNTALIRHTRLLNHPVKTIAVCGGSGSFLLQDAIAKGADMFITGDFKYHEFFDAEGKIVIADIGHYESEQFTPELLREIIAGKFPTFALHLTKVITNPVHYF